jgi:hypothetical protein
MPSPKAPQIFAPLQEKSFSAQRSTQTFLAHTIHELLGTIESRALAESEPSIPVAFRQMLGRLPLAKGLYGITEPGEQLLGQWSFRMQHPLPEVFSSGWSKERRDNSRFGPHVTMDTFVEVFRPLHAEIRRRRASQLREATDILSARRPQDTDMLSRRRRLLGVRGKQQNLLPKRYNYNDLGVMPKLREAIGQLLMNATIESIGLDARVRVAVASGELPSTLIMATRIQRLWPFRVVEPTAPEALPAQLGVLAQMIRISTFQQ